MKTNIKTTILFATLLGSVSFLQGCATPVEGARQADNMGGMTIERNAVYILDDSLHSVKQKRSGKQVVKGKISIEGKGVRQTATGLNELWVNIRNRTDYTLQVESRVTWFDASGAPVDGPSVWQRTVLQANSLASIIQTATVSDAAAYFNMEVREGL